MASVDRLFWGVGFMFSGGFVAGWVRGLGGRILYVVLAAMAAATMVNAPGIGYGYGFIVPAVVISSWVYRPLEALALVGVSHAVGDFIALATASGFATVFLLSSVLRPLVALVGSVVRGRYGLIVSGMVVAALDALLALTIAVLYYGDDGIHAGFAVYSFLWLPFAYVIYRGAGYGPLGLFASVAVAVSYMLSVYAFPSIPALLTSLAGLGVLLWWAGRGGRGWVLPVAATLLALLGLSLGGEAVFLNAKLLFYPFNPSS